MGRPKGYKVTDTPKTNTIKIRYDDETALKLDELTKVFNQSKSDVIRSGIDIQYENLQKKTD